MKGRETKQNILICCFVFAILFWGGGFPQTETHPIWVGKGHTHIEVSPFLGAGHFETAEFAAEV